MAATPGHFGESELSAYLDEELTAQRASAIEDAMRASPQLLERLSSVNARRDAGVHTLGEVWRLNRLTCPTREQLGSFLLSALPDDHAAYIQFHVEQVGCRRCQANMEDLKQRAGEASKQSESRRHKYFQSSAGLLRRGS